MYVSTKRLSLRVSSRMRCLLWLGLGMVLALSSRTVVGQDAGEPAGEPAGAQTEFGDAVEDGFLFGDRFTGQSGEAYGALFRAGWLTGPAVGRDVSIVPFEMMPYAFVGKGMFFGDIRGFRSSADHWGTNLGGGFRYHAERWDRIFGVNTYFDYDNTSGTLFRQVGFGLETLGSVWDARANAYFPTGDDERQISVNFVPGSERFVGNNILYDQRRVIGNALKGVDLELGAPLPGRVMQRHDVRAFGGWYYYDSEGIDGFSGWKTRLQGNVLPSVALQLEVTNDHVFDTNVIFGVTWTYGGYRQPEKERRTQFNRMTEPVRRNYNMVVAKTDEFDTGLVAINPNTGTPYFIEHVASYATGPLFNGTVTDPFLTVANAQANPGGDIIFVHANSVYATAPDNAVVLEPSVRVLGEGNGVEHRINIADLGQIPLPRATNFPNRPIFQNAVGDGVTLVSGTIAAPSEFSGFQIGNPSDPTSGPAGNGIVGNGIGNVIVSQTDVNFAAGDGVLLQNLSGPVTFRGSVINGPTGTALHVVGGTGGVTFGDDPVSGTQATITNSGGRGLVVDSTLAGSFVNLTGTEIFNGTAALGGQGILINNIEGAVTVDSTTIINSTTTGIDIQGGSGKINFIGQVVIDSPADDAINIENTTAASNVRFLQATPGVQITNRNAHGIDLLNNAGPVAFSGPVSISGGGLPAAIEYQGSSGNVQFQTININGGGSEGILIGTAGSDNSGLFTVTGNTTIAAILGDGILITDDDAIVNFNGVDIASRGLSGININNSRGNVVFGGTTTVGNINSTSPAVDIQNNTTANVSFNILSIIDAQGPAGAGAGLNVVNNPPTVTVTQFDYAVPTTTAGGIALFADNAGVTTLNPSIGTLSTGTGGLFITSGTINALGREAVNVQNSVIGISLTSVSTTASVAEGIVLIDNIGLGDTFATGFTGNPKFDRLLFAVTGQPLVPGSGGTIIGAAADGAFFQNTGGVSLANMNIVGSGASGVFAQTARLDMFGMQLQTNGQFGVDVLNTPFFSMFSSTIGGNGSNEVRFTAATIPPATTSNGVYSVVLGDPTTGNGNLITDANADAVLIQTVGAGAGSALNFSFVNNTATVAAATFDALHVDWTGPVLGTVSLNTFNFGNILSNGVFVNLGSATAISDFAILSNTFNAPAGIATHGIDMTTNGGPSTITIGRLSGQTTGNVMTFTSPGIFTDDIGMRFTLAANSNVNIFDNQITMNADTAEGIQFTLVQGPTNIAIDNNLIDIDDGADLVVDERGINILGVSGSVTLSGSQNNTVIMYGLSNGAGIPFFFAPGGVNGSIIVNGITVP